MASKKHNDEIPAVYKPITLNLPQPQNEQQFKALAMVIYQINLGEFMRRWRWEKKLVDKLPIMELAQVPPQTKIRMIRPEKSSAIKIKEFVPRFEIDSLYFGSHYFLGVDKKQDNKAFFLLRNALRECGKIAIGTFTMREKEYTCAIEAYKSGLLLTSLNYLDELRDIEELAVTEPEVSEDELKLARMIIDQGSVDELDMSKFTDTFKADMEALIATKAAGETFSVESEHLEAPKSTLKEALEASLTTINWQAEKSEA